MTGRRRHEALSELGIFALAYVVYFGVRAFTEGTAAAAMQHAFDLIGSSSGSASPGSRPSRTPSWAAGSCSTPPTPSTCTATGR